VRRKVFPIIIVADGEVPFRLEAFSYRIVVLDMLDQPAAVTCPIGEHLGAAVRGKRSRSLRIAYDSALPRLFAGQPRYLVQVPATGGNRRRESRIFRKFSPWPAAGDFSHRTMPRTHNPFWGKDLRRRIFLTPPPERGIARTEAGGAN
jgi:hypothetical protein